MSITDELRDYAEGCYGGSRTRLKKIADRIDEAHEKAMSEQFASLTVDMKPMTEENMAKSGWVKGPLDADGEMWHSGDMCASRWGVIEGIAYENGKWYVKGHDTSAPWVPADSIRHHHEPTVEDVLWEFANKVQTCFDSVDTITEYADRIREVLRDE